VQPLPKPRSSTGGPSDATHPPLRRYRHRFNSLAYIKLDSSYGGVIRNLSEDGMAIQVVGSLRLGQQLGLSFELLNPRLRVEGWGCVVWTNSQGQAGVEFLDVHPMLRRGLKDWMFDQLLATAELAGAKFMFVDQRIPPEARELTFSENARSPILLDIEPPDVERIDVERIDVERIEPGEPELRAAESASQADSKVQSFTTPAWLIDGLILVCALLLFLVIALGVTNTVPAWPIALMLMLAVTAAFAGLYWFLFLFWMGATPGEYLVSLTENEAAELGPDAAEEDRPRFR
jgi:PilZ domain